MKRLTLSAALAAGLALGCGSAKTSDPTPVNVKDDPRIQRANAGGGAPEAAKPQQGQMPRPTGKAGQ